MTVVHDEPDPGPEPLHEWTAAGFDVGRARRWIGAGFPLDAALRWRETWQIGRASCRERV